MALKTPPALVRAFLLPALVVLLGACGGGTTAGPPPTTSVAASVPAPAMTQARTATAPATTAPAPTPATATAPRTSARPRTSGGAAAPAGSRVPSAPSGSAADTAPPSATTTPTTPPQAAGSPLDETAQLTLVNRVSPAHYFQQGTVAGTYDGTMEVEARITSKGVIVRFTATLAGGTISGRGIAVAILDNVTWPALRGTATVTGGTGRFAGIHGRRLKVTGRARPDASKARVRLAGTVSY